MNRRDWLRRTSLALAGGLVLGNEVMEQYERLTHKKVWALGTGGDDSWWIQREIDRAKERGGVFVLPSGTYRIGRTVRMEDSFRAFNSTFYANGPTSNGPLFLVPPDVIEAQFGMNMLWCDGRAWLGAT